MDCRRSFAAFLIALASLGATASKEFPIREARWIAPERRLAALTTISSECFDPDAAKDRQSAEIGRIAFRAPLLLGGQASRAGLSCASCHRNGRGNPDFQFPGLSGPPGTADVTSSLMSKSRGDGQFNPKPIPDLARDAPKVSHDTRREDLRRFIRGLVVEEFDGPEPPAALLDGLTSYVRALRVAACPVADTRPITFQNDWEFVTASLSRALASDRTGDRATAAMLFSASRSLLGTMSERFSGRADKPIIALSRAIAAHISGPDADARLMLNADALGKQLRQMERQSLYNPDKLARALGSTRVEKF